MNPNQYQEDQQELQFQRKKNFLTKQQQIYGVFTEAFQSKSNNKSRSKTSNQFVNFRVGQKINPNSEQIEVNVPVAPKKKKKVSFAKENVVHTFEKQKQEEPIKKGFQMFTLQSFLNSKLEFAQQQQSNQQQQIIEQQKPKILSQNIKKFLKLYKFSQFNKTKQMQDYGLPTQFGMKKKNNIKPQQPKKTQQQIQAQHSFNQMYGVGFKMAAKMGFKVSQGLGKQGKGIKAPVEAVLKNAFVARDEDVIHNIVIQEQDDKQEQQQKKMIQKGVKQLFEYFSEDEKVNKVLSYLKNQYEILETSIDREQQQIQRLENQIFLAQNNTILNQEENQKIKKSIEQIQYIKTNLFQCDKYPHHALKFNIDLMIVKVTIQKIHQYLQSQLQTQLIHILQLKKDTIFSDILQTKKKLTKIYLQKQKQNIQNFSKQPHLSNLIYQKIIDLEKLQQKAVISQQDFYRINNFVKIIIQQTIIPIILPYLKNLRFNRHVLEEKLLSILQGVSNIDKQILDQLLLNYIYPAIDQYLNSIQLTDKIPSHMIIFPWFIIINPIKINFRNFTKRLELLQWRPQQLYMFNLILPWRKYFEKSYWNELIDFCICPKLLYMMNEFQISGSQQNDENISKLKSLMKYSNLMEYEHLQAIIQDTIMKKLQNTFQKLRKSESKQNLSRWLQGWRKTLSKMKNYTSKRLQKLVIN